jgi:hypothetical protein
MELWLGPSHHGSLFRSRAELQEAWLANRDRLMEQYGSHGRRPQIWWEFDGAELGLERNYDRERSTLWRAGLLGETERRELEDDWRREFERAQQPNFTTHARTGMLKGAEARAAHLAWADVPAELVEAWRSGKTAKRGKTTTRRAPSALETGPASRQTTSPNPAPSRPKPASPRPRRREMPLSKKRRFISPLE